MSTQHTPGPWFIWKERAMQEEGLDKDEIEYELSEQNHFDVMAGTPKGKVSRSSIAGCKIVVTLDEDSFGDDEEEGRQLALANARLIAAAPDLLEACQTFAEWLRREDSGFDHKTHNRETPEGEAAWREWFYGNIALCGLAQEQVRAAIAKATGEA